jgi:hypothetical protein
MPTRKIISFLYGEISPALRFRTNIAAFATGLSKLLNFSVRKAGGVSNRSGFQYVATPTFQDGLEIPGRVRLFGFNISRFDDEGSEVPVLVVYPSKNLENPQVIGTVDAVGALSADRDLTNVKVSQSGSTVIFSNGIEHWVMERPSTVTGLQDSTLKPRAVNIQGGVPTVTSKELNPIPSRQVVYSLYQVFRTGEEVFYGSYTGGVQPTAVGTSFAHNELSIPLPLDTEVKHYSLYRASSSAAGDTNAWGLVGRIPAPSVAGSKVFNDYLEVPDFTQPPPDETYFYGEFGGTKELISARLVGHYQERRVVIPNSSTSKLKEGSVILSKAGAVDQLDTQVIFTPIGAFDFTLPIGVKSKIIAILELERLVVLTTDVVVIARGGEQGLLTPSQVNPIVIGYDGCSERVTPAYAAKYGFFMSKNDERLMRVSFTVDGNVALDDMSIISDHLLEGSKVKEMHLVRGKEDTLWILKYDGTLVSVTIHQGGEATGWARHNTDGFVESITSLTSTKPFTINTNQDNETYDSLHILVVRDGSRLIERLAFREDSVPEQYDFADSSLHFGARLKFDAENSRYFNLDSNANTNENHDARTSGIDFRTNAIPFKVGHGIATGNDSLWADGQILNVEADSTFLFDLLVNQKVVIDFYYDDGDIKKVIRWTQTGDAQAAEFGSANSAPGIFDGDVPTSLRAALTYKCTRVKNKVTGLTHLANKEVSVFADGVVVSSPNNPVHPTLIVDGAGELELDGYYAWGIVGLPYESEFETLDLDTSDNRTLTEAYKLVNRVGIAFQESKGGYVGQTGSEDDLTKMQEIISREDQDLEEVTANLNEHIDVNFPAEWEKTGRVLIKQVDPLPMTILAVYPKGVAGE